MTKQRTTSDAVAELNGKSGQLGIVCAHTLGGKPPEAMPDILVVSSATSACDAGCMFLVPVAGRGAFTRAERLTLNGIPGFIGPAPNERLGVVDVMFTSDMHTEGNTAYTGLHLFTDALLGRDLNVFCRSMEKTEHKAVTRLSRMQFGRMTVFDAPLDPELARLAGDTLFAGARVRLNGGDAIIAGNGARYTSDAPSLSVIADLFPMHPEWLLQDKDGVINRLNLTLAIPLAAVADPEALLRHASALASGRTDDAEALAATEDDMAAALAGKTFRLADPGPTPRQAAV